MRKIKLPIPITIGMNGGGRLWGQTGSCIAYEIIDEVVAAIIIDGHDFNGGKTNIYVCLSERLKDLLEITEKLTKLTDEMLLEGDAIYHRPPGTQKKMLDAMMLLN